MQVAGKKRTDKWRDRLLPGVDMGVDLVEGALDTAAEIMPGDLVHGALSRTPFHRRGYSPTPHPNREPSRHDPEP